MLYTDLTKKAMILRFQTHKNQLDKSGIPYVFHPFHLAEQMDDEYSIVTALLHDVVEDTTYTISDLISMGYPATIVDALKLQTHVESVSYFDYVKAIEGNPVAKAVKLADLRHNSDTTRLNTVDDKALERVDKYKQAIELLLSDE